MLTDAAYHPDIEGYTIDDVTAYLSEYGPQGPRRDDAESIDAVAGLLYTGLKSSEVDCEQPGVLALLSDLQDCHDNTQPQEWRAELQRIAIKHKLNYAQA